jgi:uncharacterized phage-associated protein
MATAHDVAAWMVRARGPLPALLLQKLLYYVAAWSLADRAQAAFPETVEAWRNGPVVRAVYERHRHQAVVEDVGGNADAVEPGLASLIADVLAVYGDLGAEELVQTTHAEPGWLIARRGLAPDAPGQEPVDLARTAAFLGRAVGMDRRERMADALRRSRERGQMRAVLEPHRATMHRLAQ